jgi:glycosyltransferase involved in cell wall biosynthesis
MSEEKVLIISGYFPPETGAASNRIYSLAKKLNENNYKVTVISPLPNYPEGEIHERYKGSLVKKEVVNNMKLIKLYISPSNSSNKFKRLFSSLSFSISLFIYLLVNKIPDKVIIQCSPLIIGYFAVLACKLKCKKIILNVSDLWPLAGLEMGILKKGFYYNCLLRIEKFIYKNSHAIIGQSKEILSHISKAVSTEDKMLFLYRNFPEFKFPSIEENKTNKFKIVYAGLLGLAQGIENICENVNFPENIEFHIYGNGPKSEEIEKICFNNQQLFFHGSLQREKLHIELQRYDATLIALKSRIYGSVPSKIFEYTKLGLPIIYFSSGEGAKIINDLNLGIAIQEIDYKKLEDTIYKLGKNEVKLPSKSEIMMTNRQHFNLERQFLNFKKKVLNF